MWVRLKVAMQLDLDGCPRAYHPGDWVNVGKQLALSWLAKGSAELPSEAAKQQLLVDLAECCAVLPGGDRAGAGYVHGLLPRLAVYRGLAEARDYKRLVLAQPGGLERVDLWPAGFDWLATWEVLAPLVGDYRTAAELGDEGERQRTLGVVGDLRVPAYDGRLVFLRQGEATDGLLALWDEERRHGAALALTRALYRAKPLLLALPPTWLEAPEGKFRRGG